MYGNEVPFIPEEVSVLIGSEEWIKESASIQYLSSILIIGPTKSGTVKIRQNSSPKQTSESSCDWRSIGAWVILKSTNE